LTPALNLSSAVAIAILLEPTSLPEKAAPSGRGQRAKRFETRSCSGMSFAQLEYAAQNPVVGQRVALELSWFVRLGKKEYELPALQESDGPAAKVAVM
jgi:hypothetical protein